MGDENEKGKLSVTGGGLRGLKAGPPRVGSPKMAFDASWPDGHGFQMTQNGNIVEKGGLSILDSQALNPNNPFAAFDPSAAPGVKRPSEGEDVKARQAGRSAFNPDVLRFLRQEAIGAFDENGVWQTERLVQKDSRVSEGLVRFNMDDGKPTIHVNNTNFLYEGSYDPDVKGLTIKANNAGVISTSGANKVDDDVTIRGQIGYVSTHGGNDKLTLKIDDVNKSINKNTNHINMGQGDDDHLVVDLGEGVSARLGKNNSIGGTELIISDKDGNEKSVNLAGVENVTIEQADGITYNTNLAGQQAETGKGTGGRGE